MVKMVFSLISIFGIGSIFGAETNYLNSLPRSRICGESSSSTEQYGTVADDLTSLNGDGDACIYRIRNDKQQKIRLTLHELTAHADCSETDHIYVIADNQPYGPFCNPKQARHRRDEEAVVKPTDFTHQTNKIMTDIENYRLLACL